MYCKTGARGPPDMNREGRLGELFASLTPLFDKRPAPPDEESAIRFLRYSRVTARRSHAAAIGVGLRLRIRPGRYDRLREERTRRSADRAASKPAIISPTGRPEGNRGRY